MKSVSLPYNSVNKLLLLRFGVCVCEGGGVSNTVCCLRQRSLCSGTSWEATIGRCNATLLRVRDFSRAFEWAIALMALNLAWDKSAEYLSPETSLALHPHPSAFRSSTFLLRLSGKSPGFSRRNGSYSAYVALLNIALVSSSWNKDQTLFSLTPFSSFCRIPERFSYSLNCRCLSFL